MAHSQVFLSAGSGRVSYGVENYGNVEQTATRLCPSGQIGNLRHQTKLVFPFHRSTFSQYRKSLQGTRIQHGKSIGQSRRKYTSECTAKVNDIGDFGGRNPYPGELASNFGENVLGYADTEHRSLLPQQALDIIGLAQRSCEPLEERASALPLVEAKALLRKVVGWKLAETEGGLRLRGEWKVKSFSAGLTLFNRVAAVAEAENHHPDLHLEGWNLVHVDIWSHSVGGLTINDFILASKIDQIDTSDLVDKKKRFWA